MLLRLIVSGTIKKPFSYIPKSSKLKIVMICFLLSFQYLLRSNRDGEFLPNDNMDTSERDNIQS